MGFTIKICGVRDAETARVAVEAGADRLGLVFFEKSPRHLAFEGAGAVVADIRRFAPDVRVVGLMVDPPDDEAQAAVGAGVDELQLHGRETPDRLG
ncbi:MAG: N-(5'-phosphoribosyl)anthranilate isomerase, partial [Pseudomonadota bacterium]